MRLRILRLMAVVVVVWPGLQHLGVRAFQANPWRLGGWAMYATAAPVVDVTVTLQSPEGDRRMENADLSRAAAARLLEFVVWRRDLGSLVRPDRVAREVLNGDQRGAATVRLDVQRLALDGASGRFVCVRVPFVCRRDSPCEQRAADRCTGSPSYRRPGAPRRSGRR
jgi:hypothetical protein